VSDSLVLRASSVRFATPSTRILRLDLDGAVFKYLPGQAANLGLATSAERVPYSIASAPEEALRNGYLEFLIKIEPSGRWGHKFDGLGRGMRIGVQGPWGSFTFPNRPPEQHFLFIAGGTGIAPIRAMLHHMILTRQPGHPRLLFSARTPDEFAYLPELRRMARHGSLELALTATREVGPRWRGERGRIAASRLAQLVNHPETRCFVCGPSSLVNDVPVMLHALGIPRKLIMLEEW
jgi:ferredoxin-NADP reductase